MIAEAETHAARRDHADMHDRLVKWGLCWLRGGGGDVKLSRPQLIEVEPRKDGEDGVRPEDCRILMTTYRDPDPNHKPTFWTPAQISAAELLHSRVIRLPLLTHRLTLQVFYADWRAAEWYKLDSDEQAKIIRDFTVWRSAPFGVNARIDHYNRECGTRVAPINPRQFMPAMSEAIGLLIKGERTTRRTVIASNQEGR